VAAQQFAPVALVFSADSAFASINYSSSKSNTFTYNHDEDKDGPKLCSDGGGTISKGPGKLNTCVLPEKKSDSTTSKKK